MRVYSVGCRQTENLYRFYKAWFYMVEAAAQPVAGGDQVIGSLSAI